MLQLIYIYVLKPSPVPQAKSSSHSIVLRFLKDSLNFHKRLQPILFSFSEKNPHEKSGFNPN